MTTQEIVATPPAEEIPEPRQRIRMPQLRLGRRRKPARRFMIVTHRWLSLVLGLVLLLITTSGAILLYKPQLQHVLNDGAYSPSGGPATVSFSQALTTVAKAHPEFKAIGVTKDNGVLKVNNADYENFWTVDPSTGAILGEITKDPTWVGWLDNLHECMLTCEEMPGYISFLNKDVPGTTSLGYEGNKVTYGPSCWGCLA